MANKPIFNNSKGTVFNISIGDDFKTYSILCKAGSITGKILHYYSNTKTELINSNYILKIINKHGRL